MAPTPASIIYGLPRMLLRGLNAPPYDVGGFNLAHSLAGHWNRKP